MRPGEKLINKHKSLKKTLGKGGKIKENKNRPRNLPSLPNPKVPTNKSGEKEKNTKTQLVKKKKKSYYSISGLPNATGRTPKCKAETPRLAAAGCCKRPHFFKFPRWRGEKKCGTATSLGDRTPQKETRAQHPPKARSQPRAPRTGTFTTFFCTPTLSKDPPVRASVCQSVRAGGSRALFSLCTYVQRVHPHTHLHTLPKSRVAGGHSAAA